MNTPVTCFTALISIAEEEQCEELESYLRSKGSDIVTAYDIELVPRLQAIIEKCSVVFENKEVSQQELEGFFYSVVSLFHVVSYDEVTEVVDSFCLKIVNCGTSENAEWRLKLLGLIFCHFSSRDALRFKTLCHRIKLAGQIDKTSSLALDIDQLCLWIELWKIDVKQRRHLFTLLWDAYKTSSEKALPIRILKELLQTYSESDASEAESLAKELIRLVVSDPCTFVFDDLLEMAPVKKLENQPIHKILEIFVHERLSSFETFYSENKEFFDGLNLNHDGCVLKMRQLTLASLAVEQEVVPFSALGEELRMDPTLLEQFILDCIRKSLIEARISQVNKTLVIISSIHRTFKKEQWSQLHDRLSQWQQSIQALKSNLKTLSKAT